MIFRSDGCPCIPSWLGKKPAVAAKRPPTDPRSQIRENRDGGVRTSGTVCRRPPASSSSRTPRVTISPFQRINSGPKRCARITSWMMQGRTDTQDLMGRVPSTAHLHRRYRLEQPTSRGALLTTCRELTVLSTEKHLTRHSATGYEEQPMFHKFAGIIPCKNHI